MPATMARRRLDEEARLAGLAGLLAREETPWPEVLNALARWPASQRPEQGVAAVEAVVDRWPMHARGLTGLTARQLVAGEVRPYLRLIGSLNLRLVWQVHRRDVLLARMIRDGGLRNLVALTTRYDEGDGLIPLICEHIVGLRNLYIGWSRVSGAGARMLAEAPCLAQLKTLSLHGNSIDDTGAAALLESPYLHGLRYLNVHGNRLSHEMLARVREAPQWRDTRKIAHAAWRRHDL